MNEQTLNYYPEVPPRQETTAWVHSCGTNHECLKQIKLLDISILPSQTWDLGTSRCGNLQSCLLATCSGSKHRALSKTMASHTQEMVSEQLAFSIQPSRGQRSEQKLHPGPAHALDSPSPCKASYFRGAKSTLFPLYLILFLFISKKSNYVTFECQR